MKIKHYLFSALIALTSYGICPGQNPDEQAMANWQEFMTPDENHKLLESRVGKWNLTVKIWMAPGQPPMENTATSDAKMILGGRYLVETVQGEFDGKPFEGLGTTAFDKGLKKFVSTWIDNMGTGVMSGEGTYDAKKKQFSYQTSYTDPMTGKPGKGRSTDRQVDENTCLSESYKMLPDGTEFKDMEITYRRAK